MSLRFPKIYINSSETSEAIHYIALSEHLYHSFYQKNNIYFLPRLERKHINCIYYPYIEHNIKDFWIKSLQRHEKIENNNSEIIKKLIKANEFPQVHYENFEKTFLKDFKKTWQLMRELTDDLLDEIEEIHLYPTNFGSICMQYSWFLKKHNIVKLFPRIDAPISEIYKMIIFERLCIKNQYLWSENIAISEYITYNIVLKNFGMKKLSFLKATREKRDGILFKESKEYLKKLGFLSSESLNIRKNAIFWNEFDLNLTEKEKKFMKSLINNAGNIVNYEDIGKEIWGDLIDEKFSLQAISQIAKRVRAKLFNQCSVNIDVIRAVPKKGYVLLTKGYFD